jgi:hypothetical protein
MVEIIKWDGKKISKPGIYRDIPIDDYHGDICDGVSVSSSGLRAIVNDSPAHYFENSYLNPEKAATAAGEESKALVLGRATHHLILGEKNFAASFVIQPDKYTHPKDGVKDWNNNATVCKDWHAEQRAAGRTVITKGDVETIKGMAKSLAKDEMVRMGLLNGLVEHSLFYKDKATGLWVKTRPDTIPTQPGKIGGHSADVSDLKTIVDVDYSDCAKSLEERGYFMQAALIRSALKIVLDIDVATFTNVFVGKKAPFGTRPMMLDDEDLALGDICNRVGLDIMARCLKDNSWPGPGRGPGRDTIEKVVMGKFARERIGLKVMRLCDTFELPQPRIRD